MLAGYIPPMSIFSSILANTTLDSDTLIVVLVILAIIALIIFIVRRV